MPEVTARARRAVHRDERGRAFAFVGVGEPSRAECERRRALISPFHLRRRPSPRRAETSTDREPEPTLERCAGRGPGLVSEARAGLGSDMSRQLHVRDVSAELVARLRATPLELVEAVLSHSLSFDEEAWMRASERGVPEHRLEVVRAKARERAAKRIEERAAAREALRQLGFQDADVGDTLVLDGWHWYFMTSDFEDAEQLLGEAPTRHEIRGPRRGWLTSLFSRPPRHDLAEMRLAAQPASALGPSIEAAKAITSDALAHWLATHPRLNRGQPSEEPLDPDIFRENVWEPWQHLIAFAEDLRERDRFYLTWSG